MSTPAGQGLRIARLMMVLGGLSPLFILWSIRGMEPIANGWWIAGCVLMVILPNLVLWCRMTLAKKRADFKLVTIGEAEDCREHLLVYLFAIIMPLFDLNVNKPREAAAMVTALVFIVFLFWHLDLHYMNLVFAVAGYRVFTVRPLNAEDGISGHDSFVVLTKRATLRQGEKLNFVRLSNHVFWDAKD